MGYIFWRKAVLALLCAEPVWMFTDMPVIELCFVKWINMDCKFQSIKFLVDANNEDVISTGKPPATS